MKNYKKKKKRLKEVKNTRVKEKFIHVKNISPEWFMVVPQCFSVTHQLCDVTLMV